MAANFLSNAVAGLGSFLHLPEFGLSEKIAGQPAPSHAQALPPPTFYNSGNSLAGFQQQNTGGGALGKSGASTPPSAQMANPFAGASSAAQSQSDAGLQQALSQLNYNKDALNAQTGQADDARTRALSSLDTELGGLQSQVSRSKTDAQTSTDQNQQDALGTAQDVQRQNRNTLRALGILGSSAAGDLLQKPMTQYDKQRAQINTALTSRMGALDDFLNQKVSEHSNAVKDIESQYAGLIGNIQRDLRFNDTQRADAVRSANAALQGRMADIQNSMFQWNAQVATMKQNFAQQMGQMNNYQNPTIDQNSILSQVFSPTQDQGAQTVGIAQDEQKKRLLSGGV